MQSLNIRNENYLSYRLDKLDTPYDFLLMSHQPIKFHDITPDKGFRQKTCNSKNSSNEDCHISSWYNFLSVLFLWDRILDSGFTFLQSEMIIT